MSRTRNPNRTLASALQTNLIKQIGKQRRHTPTKTPSRVEEQKPVSKVIEQPLPSKYVNTKAAYQHLGISKASFFRLRKLGHFLPSPVTGRYHLDDLDREARGHRMNEIKPQIAKESLNNAVKRTSTERKNSPQPVVLHLLPSAIQHTSSKIAYEK